MGQIINKDKNNDIKNTIDNYDYTVFLEIEPEINDIYSSGYMCNKCGEYSVAYGQSQTDSFFKAKENLKKIHKFKCSDDYSNFKIIHVFSTCQKYEFMNFMNKHIKSNISIAKIVDDNNYYNK